MLEYDYANPTDEEIISILHQRIKANKLIIEQQLEDKKLLMELLQNIDFELKFNGNDESLLKCRKMITEVQRQVHR